MNDSVSSGTDEVAGEDDSRQAFYALLMEAARLVDALGDQAERDRRSFEAGWKAAAEVFFRHGYDVGYGHAHEEVASWWQGLAETVRQVGSPHSKTFAEAQAERAKHNNCEYTGGPVEWEPKVADVIELKRGVA